MRKYDYIFTGAGCAGLSLLLRMIEAGLINGKKVLLIDKAPKQKNDRTWCFWEQQPGFFESIVCKEWNQLWFHGNNFSKQFNISPYRYKMIRGIDFYKYCFDIIAQRPEIDIEYGNVSNVKVNGAAVNFTIGTKAHTFPNAVVFNSIWDEEKVKVQHTVYLLQHFKGWMIETETPSFNAAEAVLMDFRVPQTKGATFAYLLPLNEKKALVEYTVFSENILAPHEYDQNLANYIDQVLQLKEYSITEEEFGVIPMTNARFPWFADGVYNVGTAGGQTKASSGYTFQFIQKQAAAIIEHLQNNTLSRQSKPGNFPARFHFYDSVLLQVLSSKYASGSEIFTKLFSKNNPHAIFRFLDNETSITEELRIIKSFPALPFLKAAGKQLFQR